MAKPKKESAGRYAPARRLNEVKALINSTGGVTVYEIAERFRVSCWAVSSA